MKPLAGAIPTLLTPFNANLQIDWGAYRQMIAWYLERRVGGLYANCLSSEMYHLTIDERIQLTREAAGAAGGKVQVASTGNLGETLANQIRHCQQIADAGADVVMLVVPIFHDNDADLERYFFTLAERVAAPLGLYECPVPRPYHLGVELVRRLAQTGRFVAYKETSCDLTKIKALLQAVAGTPLALLQANTPYLIEAVRSGAPGSMTIAATWLPEWVAEVIDKARAGDLDVEQLHAKLCALELAQRAIHPLGTKYLLAKRGLPIQAHGRSNPPLPAETLLALDYACRQWFDKQGELL